MDLNYARDTTSGQEGLDLLSQLRAHDSTLPIVVMTAWGSVEVAVEAMRRGARDFVQKPWENARAADDRPHAGGARARAAPAAAARGREPVAQAGRPADAHRRSGVDAAGARADRARRTVGSQRPGHRRERHRQGHGRAGASRRVGPRRQGAGHRQRRRPVRRRVRERAVRPRQGRLHRRQDRSRRPVRARRRRHAVPRRDRQRPAEPAAEAAARARDRRLRARRIVAHAPGQCAHRLGHQLEPRRGSRGRPLPPGSALPPEHDRDPAAAAARAARGHSGARHALPARSTRSATARTSPASSRRRCRRCSIIRGRATSASSITRSSAAC